MKKVLIIFIICLFMSSCSNKETVDIIKIDDSLDIVDSGAINAYSSNEIVEYNENNVLENNQKYSILYTGLIDKSAIHMTITYDENTLHGYYYYDKYKKDIDFNGTFDENSISIITNNNEKFNGKINSDKIYGTWTDGNNIFEFNLVSDQDTNKLNDDGIMNYSNGDFVAKDQNFHYLGVKGEILKSNLSKNNFEKLYTETIVKGVDDKGMNIVEKSTTWINNLYIYDDKIYYSIFPHKKVISEKTVNTINRIWSSPSGEYIIYKDKAYYNKPYTENREDKIVEGIKIASFDLDLNVEAVLTNSSSKIELIYDDYIYYSDAYVYNRTSLETEENYYDPVSISNFRMKLDGSGKENLGIEGDFAGIAGDLIFYWFEGNLWKAKIGGTEASMIFQTPFEPDSRNSSYINTMNNTKEYIVISYTHENSANIIIIDFNGNIINKISYDFNNYDTNFEIEKICILDNYIYFNSKGNTNTQINRFYYTKGSIDVQSIIY